MDKVYVVTSVDHSGYESWDISYHRTRKGALKFIMNSKYYDWLNLRYIEAGSFDDSYMYISERELSD